jgi:stage II sporulation protein AA (anti-sigma F factor antagonist)
VDFAGVGYISSAGLRIMLLLARRVQDVKGRLALCGMEDAVRLVFQLAGFLPLFTVRDSREASVTEIGGS